MFGNCGSTDCAMHFFIFYALQFGATLPREVKSTLDGFISLDNGFVITKVSIFSRKVLYLNFQNFKIKSPKVTLNSSREQRVKKSN